jgi:hypothetical protein
VGVLTVTLRRGLSRATVNARFSLRIFVADGVFLMK